MGFKTQPWRSHSITFTTLCGSKQSQVGPDSTRGKLDSTPQYEKDQRICGYTLKVPYYIIHFTPLGLAKMAIIAIAMLYSKSLMFWIPFKLHVLPHLICTFMM